MIKKYNFSTSASREGTNAEKYTMRKKLFGSDVVIPLWVADMDIDTPDFVLEAVKKRLEHPVMGYEEMPRSAFEAQCDWMKREHTVEFEVSELFYSHSVVASMNTVIEAFTGKGDKIIVQTPVYPPFFHSVIENERELLKNPLKLKDDGTYSFDIEDLKSKIDEKTKLLLLCSPHNPVGRVWRREELEEILEICLKHNIIVFSDEIHSDLVYAPNIHIPFASLNDKARDITITAIGVGKTFNMAGFAISTVAITNDELRAKFKKVYDKRHFAFGSSLSHIAFEAAYKDGKEWLEELKIHLYKNFLLLKELCDQYPHFIKITTIEGTYLAWLDCRGMLLKDKELREFFVKDAKLGLSAGISFGREGSGFMRLNFALSSAKMAQIIENLQKALQSIGRKSD
ncbi:MAG: PatB family C-S lyase [Sulfurimonas sp.]|uniref:PatB family C-S lyase n=1 Tax=Sulfurimonas sp. TaxID=2022749 RepID=UPI00260A15D2|nr:PatB family C-S lyase [Sulfurimonas sp.]MDD2653257.1 PatB family C-S lyase [Sulfurimonas sp.]